MKPEIEYAIFKMYRDPEYWDGPYKTMKKAVADYQKKYANREEPQDFRIFKLTRTRMQWPRKRKS